MYVSNVLCTRHVSGIKFIRYAQNQKIGKSSNLIISVRKQTRGHECNSQDRLKLPLSKGDEALAKIG